MVCLKNSEDTKSRDPTYEYKPIYTLIKEGIKMAQPKRRWSKARTGSKRSTWKLENPNIVTCPHCHEPVLPHRVCSNCGYYNGKEVMTVKNNEENK